MLGMKMTVRDFLDCGLRFNRTHFVDKKLENKTWGACSYHLSNEELLRDYADNMCQQSIIEDSEGFFKYSLVVYVDSSDKHLKFF